MSIIPSTGITNITPAKGPPGFRGPRGTIQFEDRWESIGNTIIVNSGPFDVKLNLCFSQDESTFAIGYLFNMEGNYLGSSRTFKINEDKWVNTGFISNMTEVLAGEHVSLSSDGNIICLSCNSVWYNTCIFKYENGVWHKRGNIKAGSSTLSSNSNIIVSAHNILGPHGEFIEPDKKFISSHRRIGDNWIVFGETFNPPEFVGKSLISLSSDGIIMALSSDMTNNVMVYHCINDQWLPLGLPISFSEGLFGKSLTMTADGQKFSARHKVGNDVIVYVHEWKNGSWQIVGSPISGYGGDVSALSTDGLTLATIKDSVCYVFKFINNHWTLSTATELPFGTIDNISISSTGKMLGVRSGLVFVAYRSISPPVLTINMLKDYSLIESYGTEQVMSRQLNSDWRPMNLSNILPLLTLGDSVALGNGASITQDSICLGHRSKVTDTQFGLGFKSSPFASPPPNLNEQFLPVTISHNNNKRVIYFHVLA